MKSTQYPRPKRIAVKKTYGVRFSGGDLDGKIGYYPIKPGKNPPEINKSFWHWGLLWVEHCRIYVAKEVRRMKDGDFVDYVFDPTKNTVRSYHRSFLGLSRFLSAHSP